MLKIASRIRIFAAVPLLLGAYCLPALGDDAAMRLLTVEQDQAVQAVAARPATLVVTTSFDHASMTYAGGEHVRIIVTCAEDAYVTVLNVGPSGEVTQLYPNAFQTDPHVSAHAPLEVASGGAHIVVGPPYGAELIQVIASTQPIEAIPAAELQKQGAFSVVRGGAKRSLRLLEVIVESAVSGTVEPLVTATVSEPAPVVMAPVVVVPVLQEAHFAIINRAIKTVPPRAAPGKLGVRP